MKQRRCTGRSEGLNGILIKGIALFVLLMLAMLWVCQIVFLDEFYRAIKKNEIKSAAKAVTAMVSQGDYDSDRLRLIGERYAVCIDVYLMSWERAEVVVSASVLNRCALHSTDTRSKFVIYSEAVDNDGEYIEYFSYDPQKRVYYAVSDEEYDSSQELSLIYAVIAEDAVVKEGMDDKATTLLIFNSNVTPVSATVSTLYVLLSVFSVVVLVLTVFFAVYISKKIARPIDQLSAAADEFGNGKKVDFRVDGYSEVERLSCALEYAANEIDKTERLRRDFLANISHDIKTPITLISAYGEMMRDIPGENTAENLGVIVKESERLSLLVNELLDYSKLISGAQQFNITEMDICAHAREISARYAEMLKSEGIDVEIKCPEQALTVHADASQIGRALVNYITNASLHTGESKKIEISVTLEGEWVKVSVKDHGNGIPKEELSEIWERYYKVSRNSVRSEKGSGLGLSIVKAILERHGGAYGVNSTVGTGSEFWFALKLSEPEDNRAE